MLSFAPHYLLQNPHLQTYLGTSEFRHQLVIQRARSLLKHSETVLIKTPDGVRLQVEFAKAKNSNGKLAILFHGWEGSANSAYLLGCGQVLFDMGYNVARLNFRDHGDTHHLNQSPFNSVRLDEICEAIISLSQRYANKGVMLLGFSLGGNFALRLSSYHKLHDINIEKTIAICPAIDPVHISRSIEEGSPLYHNFFLKKWRDSLNKKYRYYPEMMRSLNDLKVKKLHKMNEVFVPLHTPFETTEDYLTAYRVTQETLNGIKNSCDIIYSDDDPIIHANIYDNLKPTAQVNIHPQNYGGHCAFLEDWSLNSWIESILPTLLAEKNPEHPAPINIPA